MITIRDGEKEEINNIIDIITKKTLKALKDYDGTILKTETVELGQSATAPEVPERQGYAFVGWDTDFSNIVNYSSKKS